MENNLNRGIVFDVKRFSIHDGPGIRTTFFLKGCPLSCVWCQNPESISQKAHIVFHASRCIDCGACIEACPVGQLDTSECLRCGACVDVCCTVAREVLGKMVSPGQIMDSILRDRVFFEESGGGVTFSGGEPMRQIGFLKDILHLCKESNIGTAVDTCGYVPWENFDRISENTDLFLYDLKHLDSDIHKRFTGVGNKLILANLIKLAESRATIVLRIPLVGGFNDNRDFFLRATEFVNELPRYQAVDILACHDFARGKYRMLNRELCCTIPEDGKLEEFKQILSSAGIYGSEEV